jgi:glyoxylase-like metal-dependent hydrolase (beta-lactamase superfamily II)
MPNRRSTPRKALRLAALLLFATFLVDPVGSAQQGDRRAPSANPDSIEIKSLHVQGNVWMLVGGFVNAAVSIGEDGVLVVDTMVEPLADKLLAEVKKLAGDKPIRYIVNTHAHPDHTGGNEKVTTAGQSIIGGNFVAQVGQAAAGSAVIYAHEETLNRMSKPQAGRPALPVKALPTDTFFVDRKDLYFNGEPIELLHQPNAHTDGDIIVWFRKSDVIVAGDVYNTTSYPVLNVQQGGSVNGFLAALNNLIDITVPKDKQEGGTYVIPGHGRLSDEADVVDYRDMATIIRDRVQNAIGKGMTLQQVKAAKLTHDYDARYGTSDVWTTDAFVEAVYRSLGQDKPQSRGSAGGRP